MKIFLAYLLALLMLAAPVAAVSAVEIGDPADQAGELFCAEAVGAEAPTHLESPPLRQCGKKTLSGAFCQTPRLLPAAANLACAREELGSFPRPGSDSWPPWLRLADIDHPPRSSGA